MHCTLDVQKTSVTKSIQHMRGASGHCLRTLQVASRHVSRQLQPLCAASSKRSKSSSSKTTKSQDEAVSRPADEPDSAADGMGVQGGEQPPQQLPSFEPELVQQQKQRQRRMVDSLRSWQGHRAFKQDNDRGFFKSQPQLQQEGQEQQQRLQEQQRSTTDPQTQQQMGAAPTLESWHLQQAVSKSSNQQEIIAHLQAQQQQPQQQRRTNLQVFRTEPQKLERSSRAVAAAAGNAAAVTNASAASEVIVLQPSAAAVDDITAGQHVQVSVTATGPAVVNIQVGSCIPTPSSSSSSSASSSSNPGSSSSSTMHVHPSAGRPSRPRPRSSQPYPAVLGVPAYNASSSSSSTAQTPSVQQRYSNVIASSSSSSSSTGQTPLVHFQMQQQYSNVNASSKTPQCIPAVLNAEHHKLLRQGGLTALPGWQQWGEQQLLQDWNAVIELLPAAVERLRAVSLSGPVKLVCFDLETCNTGTSPDIIELAAGVSKAPHGAESVESFERLVRPLGRISAAASETTNITWDMVKDQQTLPQVLLQWLDWLEQQCSSSSGGSSTLIFTGYNIKGFDLPILRTWATTFNLPQLHELLTPKKITRSSSSGSSSGSSSSSSWGVLDTYGLTIQAIKSFPLLEQGLMNKQLQTVRQYFGIPVNQAHRAMDDVITTMQVFTRLAQLHTDTQIQDLNKLADLLLKAQLEAQKAVQAELLRKKQEYKDKQQQQQQQQRPPDHTLDSLISSSSSSTRSYIGLQPAVAAASLPDLPDPAAVESKVSNALDSLSDRDLKFNARDLDQCWYPLSCEIDDKMKGFTDKQSEKLVSAGFPNLLKVLLHAPKILVHTPFIRVSGSSSSSSSSMSSDPGPPDAAAAAAPVSSSDSDESLDDVPGVQLVDVKGTISAVFKPVPWMAKSGATWRFLMKVPADPPDAGPVNLSVIMHEFGWTSMKALQQCKTAQAAANKARQQQQLVSVRARVRQMSPWFSSAVSETVEWETDGKVVVSYLDDADDDTAASSSSSSSEEEEQTLVPVYKAIRDLKPEDWLNKGRGKGVADKAIDLVKSRRDSVDLLPAQLLQRYNLPTAVDAFGTIHKPQNMKSLAAARTTLALQELTLVQIAQLLERYWLQRGIQQQQQQQSSSSDTDDDAPEPMQPRAAAATTKRGTKRKNAAAATPSSSSTTVASASGTTQQQQAATAYQIENMHLVDNARKILPYDLTPDQDNALSEVLSDISKPQAMLRLLQGDVGCGKTVVALLACLAAAGSGYQSLVFAPTELLATQHLETLRRIAEELPLSQRPRIELLSSVVTTKPKEREAVHTAVAEGRVDILISTQAALFVKKWGKLALVVVDEQHKFGVKQRERLLQNLPAPPHMLLMSATPIPRTLALVTFGGLTLSTITTMPPGRRKVDTRVIVDSEDARHEVYTAIHDELVSGGRVYIVCPLVYENEDLEGVKAAEDEHQRLQESGLFGDFKCGLLHGKMKGEEKAAVLKAFSSGEAPVLIASTVVEVGIDEPEASIMLVENAERFGLAQLHQLRGRVGRGKRPSSCYLIAPAAESSDRADVAAERLRVLENSHNGLHIAEADLRIRGPGDVWGIKQSGKPSAYSNLTWQELQATPELIDHARAAAAELLPQIGSRPEIKAALLAYGLMTCKEGQQVPVLRDGVSGV